MGRHRAKEKRQQPKHRAQPAPKPASCPNCTNGWVLDLSNGLQYPCAGPGPH